MATPERTDISDLFALKIEEVRFGDNDDSFSANPFYGIITGSWWAAEALWCVSFAHAAWSEPLESAISQRRQTADIFSHASGYIAAGLISFARRTLSLGTRQIWLHTNASWPYAADGTLQAGSDELVRTVQLAEELFLGALGWIMLHEFAHIDRDHGKGLTIDEEREADEQATRWLFERAPFGAAAARADSLTCAQLFMWLRETLSDLPDYDHPPVADRIITALRTAGVHRNAWSTCILAAIAEILFHSDGKTMPASLGIDFSTCEAHLLGVITAMGSK